MMRIRLLRIAVVATILCSCMGRNMNENPIHGTWSFCKAGTYFEVLYHSNDTAYYFMKDSGIKKVNYKLEGDRISTFFMNEPISKLRISPVEQNKILMISEGKELDSTLISLEEPASNALMNLDSLWNEYEIRFESSYKECWQ